MYTVADNSGVTFCNLKVLAVHFFNLILKIMIGIVIIVKKKFFTGLIDTKIPKEVFKGIKQLNFEKS